MRILHLINSVNPSEGGTVECVRQIGSCMSLFGHQVEVAALADNPEAPWITGFPLEVHALGPALGRYSFSRRVRTWLEQYGRSYDAFIVNGLWQYQGVSGSRAARRMGIPYFVYAHGMLDPWNRRAHPFKYVKKFAYWLAAERQTLECAAGVVFTSEEEKRLAPHYFPSAKWKSLVVGNGIAEPPQTTTEDIAALRRKVSVDDDQPVWLFLSRLHSKKGLENLLKAVAAAESGVAAPVVLIAGSGEDSYVAKLKRMAAELGIEKRIRWVGPLYGAEKWAAFRTAELFVLPSHQENFGIVVAEALAVGLPVCTTRQVNIWREVEESGAGLVCEDTLPALSEALRRWADMHVDARRQMRTRARACFLQHFKIETAARCLVDAIRASTGAG